MLAAVMLPMVQADAVAALDAELRSNASATAVLQRRCAGPIRAVVDRTASKQPSAETRARLRVDADTPVLYRLVRLMCGDTVLSNAENWFVPDRLSPFMRRTLAETETPFGVVIRPYAPSRRTIAVERPNDGGVLRHRALVLAEDRPLAEVVETYTEAATAPPR